MSRPEPIAIQLALIEAYAAAERLLAEEGRVPLFALFHRAEREPPVLAVLRGRVGDDATALEALREDAPAIARGHQAQAVTLGGAGVLVRVADGPAAEVIWQGLRSGTLDSLSDAPGARHVLLLEHHRRSSVTRAAFPLWSHGLGAQQLFAHTVSAAEAEPFAGLRFFPAPARDA
jgi:hypothetical protein